VLFITTANNIETIQPALKDRMEMINVSGYLAEEKFEIAKNYLVPKQLEEHGLDKSQLKFSKDAIEKIIDEYTHESGVRGLEKQIAKVARVTAKKIALEEKYPKTVKASHLREYLGLPTASHDKQKGNEAPGVVTGLAWTAMGGEILFIETLFTKGSGKVVVTGQLGDVMKESVQIAISLVKAMYPDKVKLFSENDLHIHVPEGAIPKDGPSAGITLTTALASLVTGREVSPEWAMTGEVSLRGGVMPIGGLPEKLMAAQRAGIRQVFIPEENREDLDEVAEEVKSALKIFPVKKISDVLEKLDLHLAETEKKGKKKKTGIPADPFGNAEAFWGIGKSPISIRPVD
jgi:ATP-dependent Lon protease